MRESDGNKRSAIYIVSANGLNIAILCGENANKDWFKNNSMINVILKSIKTQQNKNIFKRRRFFLFPVLKLKFLDSIYGKFVFYFIVFTFICL